MSYCFIPHVCIVHSVFTKSSQTPTHTHTQNANIYPISDLWIHPHEIIFNNIPDNTNVQIVPQNCQPTRTVPQPRASFSEELQLCSEASSLPLNHGTLILRTCRLAAFHFMQLRLKALLISAKLKPQLGKHFVLLHDDHHILHEVIRPL